MSKIRLDKIKIVCTLPDLSGGGAERVMSILIKYLDSSRYEVHLVIGKFIGVNTENIPNYVIIHELGNLRSNKIIFPLIKVIKKINPDYVIATLGFVNPVVLGKIFFPKKTKIIVRYGNTMGSFLSEIRSNSIILYYFYYFLTQLVNYFSDIIISQCEFMKNDLIQNFHLKSINIQKIVTIYNPIESAKIKQLSCNNSFSNIDYNTKKGPFLISVGRLEWQKGFDILIKAMSSVKLKYPDFVLTIYGEGKEKESLQKLIFKNGLKNNISLQGYNKNPYYDISKSNLFLIPSRYEGFSNSIIESIALGTPVVATDCPSGVREIIKNGENGWLCSKNEDEYISSFSSTTLASLDKINSLNMDIESKKIIAKFGQEIFADKVDQLIKNNF